MSRFIKVILCILLLSAVGLFIAQIVDGHTIAILQPKGVIAAEQRNLIIVATLLMLIVVIPVFLLTAIIAWRYRADNPKATYSPDWDHSNLAEAIWWGLPCAIIIVLAVLTWKSSQALDPFRPLQTEKTPVTIQVVALQWKWLFIYPEQGVASVNYVQFPEDTPVNFVITADAPMNSFWIPQLGGQIYAMTGMSTKLHLMADEPGTYAGVSANLSGEGFAGMRFSAVASSKADFEHWISTAKLSRGMLNMEEYKALAKPTAEHPVAFYSATEKGLYNQIVMQYMAPADHRATAEPSSEPNDNPEEYDLHH